jgi:hypothetical protein
MVNEEDEEGSSEEEGISGEEDRSPKEGRERPSERSDTSTDKRSKNDRGESVDNTATDDLPIPTIDLGFGNDPANNTRTASGYV